MEAISVFRGMLMGMRMYVWVFDVSTGWRLSGWKRARGDGDGLRLGTLEDDLATVWKRERVGHTRCQRSQGLRGLITAQDVWANQARGRASSGIRGALVVQGGFERREGWKSNTLGALAGWSHQPRLGKPITWKITMQRRTEKISEWPLPVAVPYLPRIHRKLRSMDALQSNLRGLYDNVTSLGLEGYDISLYYSSYWVGSE